MHRPTMNLHHAITIFVMILALIALIIASIAISGDIDYKADSIPTEAVRNHKDFYAAQSSVMAAETMNVTSGATQTLKGGNNDFHLYGEPVHVRAGDLNIIHAAASMGDENALGVSHEGISFTNLPQDNKHTNKHSGYVTLRANKDLDRIYTLELPNTAPAANGKILNVASTNGSVYTLGWVDNSTTTSVVKQDTGDLNVTLDYNVNTNGKVLIENDHGTDATEAIKLDAKGGGITLSSAGATSGAITINANTGGGGMDVNLGTSGLAVDVAAGGTGISLDSGAASNFTTSAGILTLDGAGGIVLNANAQTLNIDADTLDMDFTNSSTITVTSSGDAEDLTIEQVGANNSSIILRAAGTGGDAIRLETHTNAGGITINAAGSFDIDGDDSSTIDVVGNGKHLTLGVSGGGTQVLTLSSAGTGTNAIDINATAGGIEIDTVKPLQVTNTGTTTDSFDLICNSITTGNVMDITSTSTGITTGKVLNVALTSSGSGLSNKTTSISSLTSSRTETRTTGTTSDDYDLLSLTRTNTMNGVGGTLTSTGSVLRIENVATQTTGTLTDTTKGIELVMDADGTGQGIHITQNNTGQALFINHQSESGTALEISSAITTGKGMRIVGDAITTGNLIELYSNSSTTGQRNLALINNDNTASTGVTLLKVVNDAVASGSGQSVLFETTVASETNPLVRLKNSNADANGPILRFENSDGNDGSDDDYCGTISFIGKDDGTPTDVEYAKIEVQSTDVSSSAKNGSVSFKAMIGNAEKEIARINPESTTANTFMGGFGIKVPVLEITAATYVIGNNQSGTTYILNRAGGITITLPSDDDSNFGSHYRFLIMTDFSGTFTLSADNTADLFYGGLTISSTGGSNDSFQPNGTDNDQIVCDSNEKGRLAGGFFECTLLKANTWLINGVLVGSGTVVTPFV